MTHRSFRLACTCSPQCETRVSGTGGIVREAAASSQRYSIPERHLAAVWESAAVPGAVFLDVRGRRVEIRSIGVRNRHDGPDYLGAELRIDGVSARGGIELHPEADDWYRHGHDGDPRYRRVILHVVLHLTAPMPDLPTIAIADQLPVPFRIAWARAIACGTQAAGMPCAELPARTAAAPIEAMTVIACAMRLERKAGRMRARLAVLTDSDARGARMQVLYESVARALGYGANADACEALARALPLRAITAARWTPPDLLHGFAVMAGVNRDVAASLPSGIRARVASAVLPPDMRRVVPRGAWLSAGVRPGNRIGRRLPALAVAAFNLAAREEPDGVADILRSSRTPVDGVRRRIERLFESPDIPWARPGKDRILEILVNAVAPLFLAAALIDRDERLAAGAVRLFEDVRPAPDNAITKHIRSCFTALDARTSREQQGILELDASFCGCRRCGDCLVGQQLHSVR